MGRQAADEGLVGVVVEGEPRAKSGLLPGKRREATCEDADSGARGGLERVLAEGQEPSERSEDRSEAESEGGRSAEGRRALSPHQELPGRQERFAQALAEGLEPTEAAALVGVGSRTALGWLNSTDTARRIVFLVRQGLSGKAGKALRRVEDLISANSERVSLDAALAILDRAGVSSEVQVPNNVSIFIDLRDN